jgi:hypothetical protein
MQVGYSYRARPVVTRHKSVLGGLPRYLVASAVVGVLLAAAWLFSGLLGSASSVVR